MRKIFFIMTVLMTPLLTMCSGPYGHMGGWDRTGNYACGFGYGYGGVFMWILFLIVVGVAVYFIIQSAKAKNILGGITDAPLDIIKKRYAKGDITKEEFDRMKKELE